MDLLLKEIQEIGEKAAICYEAYKGIVLPRQVLYLGMGSSYFACLTLKYIGLPVFPEIASEYYHYLAPAAKQHHAVLLSQSGRSTEVIWCRDLFMQYTAITNNADSPLALGSNRTQLHLLQAGPEACSSTKTYINTLITLYNGHGLTVKPVIDILTSNVEQYKAWGEKMAEVIFSFQNNRKVQGFYIIANGPNLATAYQAALVLSETTKLPFQAMAASQYDHGPKEAAKNSFVLVIDTDGPLRNRTRRLADKVKQAGAETAYLNVPGIPEALTPFPAILAINYLMYYLGVKLGIKNIFEVGDKITEV